MKKTALFILSFLICTNAFAARITIDIADNIVQARLDDYIAADPIPLDENGNSTMSPAQWVKQSLINVIRTRIEQGRRIKAEASQRVNAGDVT